MTGDEQHASRTGARRRLPDGYTIHRVACPQGYGHDTFILAFARRPVTQVCAQGTPSWWTLWRLRRRARTWARNDVTPR